MNEITTASSRVPAGVPSGGQFASAPKAEATDVVLELDRPVPDVGFTDEAADELNCRVAANAVSAFAAARSAGADWETPAHEMVLAGIALRSTRRAPALASSVSEGERNSLDRMGAAINDYVDAGDDSDRLVRAEWLHAALNDALDARNRTVRTFQGRSAAQWREQAATSLQRSADSWKRSDTDGFLSQWAGDTMAGKYEASAELAEQGGKAEFPALLNEDGTLARAKQVDTRYGSAWMLLDEADQPTGDFVSISQASTAERRNAYYAKKGYRMGRVVVPATVRMSDGLAPHPYFARTDGGFDLDAEIVATEEVD